MSPRAKPPVSARPGEALQREATYINLREPEEIGVPVEQHQPIVRADELFIPKRLIDVLDRALAEGEADAGDDCAARLIETPPEAALVHLAKSSLLYVSFGLPRPGLPNRPRERWIPAALLQRASLNGWNYMSVRSLYEEASEPIRFSLEHLFGRGERWSSDTGAGGCVDAAAQKMTGVERAEVTARVEIDPSGPGSGSKTEFLLFRGCWLPFRRINKLAARRIEQEQRNYPKLDII